MKDGEREMWERKSDCGERRKEGGRLDRNRDKRDWKVKRVGEMKGGKEREKGFE